METLYFPSESEALLACINRCTAPISSEDPIVLEASANIFTALNREQPTRRGDIGQSVCRLFSHLADGAIGDLVITPELANWVWFGLNALPKKLSLWVYFEFKDTNWGPDDWSAATNAIEASKRRYRAKLRSMSSNPITVHAAYNHPSPAELTAAIIPVTALGSSSGLVPRVNKRRKETNDPVIIARRALLDACKSECENSGIPFDYKQIARAAFSSWKTAGMLYKWLENSECISEGQDKRIRRVLQEMAHRSLIAKSVA